MKITFKNTNTNKEALIIPVSDGNVLPDGVPPALEKIISKALRHEKTFGKKQTLVLRGSTKKVILLGVGNAKDLDETSVRQLAAPLYKTLTAEGVKQAAIVAALGKKSTHAKLAAHLADALLFESYEFKKYKTSGPKSVSNKPDEIEIVTHSPKRAAEAFEPLRHLTESVFWASDLANEPGNVLNPETYAEKIKNKLNGLGIKITVLEQKDMQKLGMGAALAVGQGSVTPPCMVVMEYNNCSKQKQPLALVGKGITFDSGGISLKPGAGMGDMTLDMSGSAAVVGAMRAIALRQTNANIVAIVALAENMPDGKSYRPGDILNSMSGKTIYVGNTDAEGRLVLADALTYIQRTYNPHTIVDLATLTGAAVGALGTEFAAVYANDNSLWKKFNAASGTSGEKIWRMPLMETDSFTQAVENTPLADLANISSGPGSCTAAAFLRAFIEKDATGQDKCQWMHIDMAGPGIPNTLKKGWGVKLLSQVVQDHYESPKPKKASAPARKRP